MSVCFWGTKSFLSVFLDILDQRMSKYFPTNKFFSIIYGVSSQTVVSFGLEMQQKYFAFKENLFFQIKKSSKVNVSTCLISF